MKHLTQKEIGELVVAKLGGKLDNSESSPVAGPFKIGTHRVWQVWTIVDGFYHAHHVIAEGDKDPIIFEDFPPFAQWLSDEVNAFSLVQVRIVAALLIVFTALALLVYLVVWREQAVDAAYLLTALVGGAVAYLLGDWVRKH